MTRAGGAHTRGLVIECDWCYVPARFFASTEPSSGRYACRRHIAQALNELAAEDTDLRIMVDIANEPVSP